MATILRGKRKGEEVTIDQWCNDWVTVHNLDYTYVKVVGITALKFTPEELYKILTSENLGIMLTTFEVDRLNGRFIRKKRLGEFKK